MRSGRPSRLVVTGLIATVALALAHRGEIHARAASAVGRGMPAREAVLARGFVLGEDERVDDATVEDFRRSGLAHLLAVSGQNVALLGLLAMPLLAALGIPLRTRLLWVLAAIAVYVPLAGAGPSIVRAGVMGALNLVALLVGRRGSRLYALAVAAAVGLAVDPGIAADVGWQLSFAAVLGILALGRPLRETIVAWLGGGRGWRGTLADGAALTIAATLATAPLVAFHFEAVPTTTLLANLLALPAVAPAMWLGMLAGIAGQVPGFPVAALNAVNAPLLAYIAQVAAWCGDPGWAYPHVHLGTGGLLASYAALALAAAALHLRCNAFGAYLTPNALHRRWAGVVVALSALVLACAATRGGAAAGRPVAGLRVSVLDVGQGSALLLQPARAPAVLVDGGPPGAGLATKLREAGVDRLGAAIVTHEQADHAGGVEELLGQLPIGRLLHARLSRRLRGAARAAGVAAERIAAGAEVRSGRLRLEVLWPPRPLLSTPLDGADPNTQAVVLLARWRRFSMLLTADAEAEAVPLDPGPVDVLEVAHHGSEDAGLDSLLERTRPRLALISVGDGNPFGHPTRATLATLARRRIPVLRTDRDGTIVLGVRHGALSIETGE